MKAGLFDRAEEAYKALAGTSFDTEARLALLDLHERSRDWRAAVAVAEQLESERQRLVRLADRPLPLRARARGRRCGPARRRRCRRWRSRATPRRPMRGRSLLSGEQRRGARRPRRRAALVEHADVGAAGGVQPGRQALRDERAGSRRRRWRAGPAAVALRQGADARPARRRSPMLQPDDGSRRERAARPSARAPAASAAAAGAARRVDGGHEPRGTRRRLAARRPPPASARPRPAPCATRSVAPPGRSIAIAAPPAASRRSTISGNAPGASAGTLILRNDWRTCEARSFRPATS